MNHLLPVGLTILTFALEAGRSPAPPPSPRRHVAPEATAAARQEDLSQFRTHFLGKDRSYSATARAEAESRLARLESAAPEASEARFELEIARIVGLADNGHTAAFAGPRSRRHNRVEIRLVPFMDGFHVLRAKRPHGDLLGARLLAIEDQPVSELREVARSLMGGTDAWRDRAAPYFFESPEQLHALGLIARHEGAVYRFEASDGSRIERHLAAEPANPDRPRGNADRWLYPELMEDEGGEWRALVALERTPWAFQDPRSPFRWRDAPELEALVIELRRNADSGGRSIGEFFDEMSRRIRDRRPRNLVLDMRMNGGGDLTRSRDFMQSLPGLVPGRIFALISPWTFSAAIASVGYLEQAAPDRVVLVGEPVGDRLRFWAEGEFVVLPHSKAAMLYATERHDYVTGCRPFPDCHRNVERFPIAVGSLDPDIAAPWTIDAYRAGRDPAMEAVAAALHEGR